HFNLDHINLIWPVTGRVVDGYHPDTDLNDFGIGIESLEGSPVVAVAAGEVFENGENGWIVIQHNEELFSAYRTDTPVSLEKKQQVKQGQKIAMVGKLDDQVTGIYFSLVENKIALDPLEVLPKKSINPK
ncbi:MAG: peptidoglycan DD-metalloendopeptidase family protein, partial [Desulfuromonadales bacterium]|nr:peptidoglycan DD-metalloendopeptidase family protein [Desulfuromonadales bacterium]